MSGPAGTEGAAAAAAAAALQQAPTAAQRTTPKACAPTQVLVELARAGDENAFEALVREHQDRAYAVALRMTGSHHDAQDVVQDAFLHAWQGLPGFRGDAQFSTWLTSIVLNSCHALRRAARPTDPLRDDTPTAPSPAADTVAVAAAHQHAAQDAVLALPFDQRAALVLHVFSGYSHAHVGQVLGISENAAKVRVHRARQSITIQLKDWR